MSRQRDHVVSVEILADFEALTFRLARELAHTTPYPMRAWAAAITRVRAGGETHDVARRLTGDYCAADGDDYPCPTRRALDGGGE